VGFAGFVYINEHKKSGIDERCKSCFFGDDLWEGDCCVKIRLGDKFFLGNVRLAMKGWLAFWMG
jgi:hypothetical protein